MPECDYEARNNTCGCSYSSCSRRGKCCECISHHLEDNQLPGCVFAKISSEAEQSYNRDFEYFASLVLNSK